jgi:radical SAM-linked protein
MARGEEVRAECPRRKYPDHVERDLEMNNIKYQLAFCKKGDMVYISHLDLMKLFRRAVRRTGLPFFLTEGFTPRVKLSMPRALKLGAESEQEEMALWLTDRVSGDKIKQDINSQLPEGIKILTVSG